MFFSIPLFKKVQGKLDTVTGLTRENLTGVRVIRAFCREKEAVAEFDTRNQELTKLNLFVGKLSALLNPVTYVLINIATVILIQKAGVEVNLGGMQQGQVVALYNYMAQMIVELIKLASLDHHPEQICSQRRTCGRYPESEIYYGLPLFLHIFCSDIEGPCNSNC